MGQQGASQWKHQGEEQGRWMKQQRITQRGHAAADEWQVLLLTEGKGGFRHPTLSSFLASSTSSIVRPITVLSTWFSVSHLSSLHTDVQLSQDPLHVLTPYWVNQILTLVELNTTTLSSLPLSHRIWLEKLRTWLLLQVLRLGIYDYKYPVGPRLLPAMLLCFPSQPVLLL